MLKKNDQIQVKIAKLNHEGMGVAFVAVDENEATKTLPIYVENALPEEEVLLQILRVENKRAFGKVLQWFTESPHRRPMISFAGFQTGTMPLQHLTYEQQLLFKQEQVAYLMRSVAKMPEVEVRSTLPCPEELYYRNKAQIPVRPASFVQSIMAFGKKKTESSRLRYGFFRKNSHDLLAMKNFYLHDEAIDELLEKVIAVCEQQGVSAYDEATHTGNLRHVVLRRSRKLKEVMLILVTCEAEPLSEALVQALVSLSPEIVSVVQNIQPKQTNVIMGEESRVLYGEDAYRDELLGLTFKISSKSFFQVNSFQTENLYREVLKAAQLTGTEQVVDAYCGIGSISLALARESKKVYGLEIVPEAIENAKENARLNGLENVHFEVGDAKVLMPKWADEGLQADVLVVDPPRKGLDEAFIEASVKLGAGRIVYVSCNPATMARDVALYRELGYVVQYVQPVDMFPQTEHVECVVLLSKVK